MGISVCRFVSSNKTKNITMARRRSKKGIFKGVEKKEEKIRSVTKNDRIKGFLSLKDAEKVNRDPSRR